MPAFSYATFSLVPSCMSFPLLQTWRELTNTGHNSSDPLHGSSAKSKVIPITTQAQVLLNLFLLLLFLSFKSLDSNALSWQSLHLLVFHRSERITQPDQSEDSLSSQSDAARINRSSHHSQASPDILLNQQKDLFSSEIGREKEDGVCHYHGLLLMPFWRLILWKQSRYC